nr:MAG TPA: hypothetical protein [Caudoviricetes sp.]DAW73226.1 MAG TPA: hypothetical protein [Caudoviricetes sp.]
MLYIGIRILDKYFYLILSTHLYLQRAQANC